MTKILTILMVFFCHFPMAFCQNQIDQKGENTYDSTKNFLGTDVNRYVGQEFYLNRKALSLRSFGYEGFYTDYKKGKDQIKILNDPLSDNGVYKCCDFFNSEYDSLAGKYFKVLEVIKHPKAEENESLYGRKYFLKLKPVANNDVVYYEYDSKFEHNFPFIVVGFWEKLKERCIGQSYIYGKKNWDCIGVAIEEEYYNLSLVLKDKNSKTINVGYSHLLEMQKK